MGSCRPADPGNGNYRRPTSCATEMFRVTPANQPHPGRNRDTGSTAQDRFLVRRRGQTQGQARYVSRNYGLVWRSSGGRPKMRKVFIIGIGAGNPDYITVQAINALNEVDVF